MVTNGWSQSHTMVGFQTGILNSVYGQLSYQTLLRLCVKRIHNMTWAWAQDTVKNWSKLGLNALSHYDPLFASSAQLMSCIYLPYTLPSVCVCIVYRHWRWCLKKKQLFILTPPLDQQKTYTYSFKLVLFIYSLKQRCVYDSVVYETYKITFECTYIECSVVSAGKFTHRRLG